MSIFNAGDLVVKRNNGKSILWRVEEVKKGVFGIMIVTSLDGVSVNKVAVRQATFRHATINEIKAGNGL